MFVRRLSCAAILGAFAATAFAGAPMTKAGPPGYYRMTLGDFEIVALNDGTVDLPVNKLLAQKPAETDRELAQSFLKSPLETSFNAFLVNTGGKLVLIDTGAAGLFGPTLGRLLGNLKAAGYTPEQVDEIYITHMHGDHVGGLVANGQAVFPNAIVRADKRDADYFLSQANLDKAPADQKGNFQGPIGALGPYQKAGKFKPFDGSTDLVPGVKAVASYGHTPGHTVYVIESRGQKLLLWGDSMHVAPVQFEHPEITISFDSDSKAAKAERLKYLADAAKNGYYVGGAHLSFPGIGHVRADGKHYDWLPVNYSVPR
jgi:glyoxylase-like metal-dependent hydrolase (beta-lactamase superfamily II)